MAEDKGLEKLLGVPFASPDALLDFLGQFHDPKCWEDRPPEKKAWVAPESEGLRALEAVNRVVVARGAERSVTRATIDHDGTIIEAHKRDAQVAYDGTRGFQPWVAVWAEQQLVVSDEFRDGNVAGGEDPLSSVKRALANLPPWVVERRRFGGVLHGAAEVSGEGEDRLCDQRGHDQGASGVLCRRGEPEMGSARYV